MTRVHIDTDFGGDPDDACALVLALGWQDAEVVGITTTLEHEGKRAGCAAYYLRVAGRSDIPLAPGTTASFSTGRRYESTWGDERYWPEPVEPVAAADGVALEDGALDRLQASIEAGAAIVAIGSFTNLARLELRSPGALADVSVVATAGWLEPAAAGLPQWGPPFDFNVQCDPRAVEIVAATADLTLVPLPLSMTVQLRTRDLARLRTAGPCGALLARQSEAYATDAGMTALAQQHVGLPADLVNFHWDPLTCAVALGGDGVTIEQRPLATRTAGGVLRFEPSTTGRPTRIVTAVDADAFVERFAACVERVGPPRLQPDRSAP